MEIEGAFAVKIRAPDGIEASFPITEPGGAQTFPLEIYDGGTYQVTALGAGVDGSATAPGAGESAAVEVTITTYELPLLDVLTLPELNLAPPVLASTDLEVLVGDSARVTLHELAALSTGLRQVIAASTPPLPRDMLARNLLNPGLLPPRTLRLILNRVLAVPITWSALPRPARWKDRLPWR